MTKTANQIRSVEYQPAHKDAFRDLNLDWIERYFEVEESDRTVLADPQGEIIDRGGFIFVALDGDTVAGVCALIPEVDGAFQLAKMAVSPWFQGRGIGRLLANAAIAHARARGAPHVGLYTNTILGPAMGLYRSLGFVEAPLEGAEHRRSNIRLVLDLR